jgi:hypothetical protein
LISFVPKFRKCTVGSFRIWALAEETAVIMVDQGSRAATNTDVHMHNVTAIKIEAADEPSDPMYEDFFMVEDDVAEQSSAKADHKIKSEQVYDRVPISATAPPLPPKPDIPEDRLEGAEWILIDWPMP